MLLNSVNILSTFPFEKIGVIIDDTMIPEGSARMGIRLRNTYYDNGELLLNWGSNLLFKQTGVEPDVLWSETLSSYYDEEALRYFRQPTEFVDLPADFPIFFETSAIPYNSILLHFKGGVSAITIFPSMVYPIIQKIDQHVFTVSAGFLSLSAFNQNLTRDEYYKTVPLDDLVSAQDQGIQVYTNIHNYTGPGATVYNMSPHVYYSAHKDDSVIMVASNNLKRIGTSTARYIINPSNPKIIIPESFTVTFPVSTSYIEFPYTYTLGYWKQATSTQYDLTGLAVEALTSLPIVTYARLKFDSGYKKPGLDI